MIYFNDQQALTAVSINKVNFILPSVVYWANHTVNCSFRISKSTDSPTNLGEGNIFTGVCHSVQGVGMPGPKSLPGVGGYACPRNVLGVGIPATSPKKVHTSKGTHPKGTPSGRYIPQKVTLWKVHPTSADI